MMFRSVTGDRVQLQQVILNLLRNASDAMADVHDRPRRMLIRTECEPSGNVRLSVQDAGVGLDPHNIEKLFDSFYTTKSRRYGHRVIRQPLDHREASWPSLGGAQ